MRDGLVACPYKGNVDVELCYRCPQLRAFADDESGTKVICATPLGVVDGLVAALGAAKRRYRT
jgi:hypothetical protein